MIEASLRQFRKAAKNDVRKILKVFYQFYVIDKKNNLYCFEFQDGKNIILLEVDQVIYNDVTWTIIYAWDDDPDSTVDPFIFIEYPIKYTECLTDIIEEKKILNDQNHNM